MRTPFAYYGGKSAMARRIVDLMPAHRVYIEPFFGSGAVLFAKRPCSHEIINDADDALVTFYRVLRSDPDGLSRACALTPHARSEFEAADLSEEVDDMERARRFWVRITQSFGQHATPTAGWSVTVSANGNRALRMIRSIDRFGAVAERLASVTIENCDATDLISRMATASDAVVYVDPPYLASTRRNARDQSASDYRVDMASDAEHRRLGEALLTTPATVILSGYRSDLYDDMFADWDRLDLSTRCATTNGLGGKAERVECIWVNRPVDHGRLFAMGAS